MQPFSGKSQPSWTPKETHPRGLLNISPCTPLSCGLFTYLQVLPLVHIITDTVPAQAPASLLVAYSSAPTPPAQTTTSPAPAFSVNFSIALSSSPSPPISHLIQSSPALSTSTLSSPILPSPLPSPSTYINSESKFTAAKMLRAVLKKMEDREKRAIALPKKIVDQNEQMTGVLCQISQELTSMLEVMCKWCEKLNK